MRATVDRLCNYVAISTSDDTVSWAAAGDQAIITISGVDSSKIRCVHCCGKMESLI